MAGESVHPEDDDTLKYQLLGPSLTKAGQNAVDQQKVSPMPDNVNDDI